MATDARDLKIDVVEGAPLEKADTVARRAYHVADAEQYLRTALPAISRILASVDRNPFSPSYGCCDRQYWHYRTASFASEMYQEAALPLALAYTKRYPTSDWFGETRLAETAVAILRFSAKNAHADGSCDDYYPQERALGAAVFSLQAATETYRLLELDDAELLKFFARRAEWIAANDESGRLTNHHALSALALWRMGKLTGRKDFEQAAIERLERVVAWQSPEGWFPEYEGADPGYQTVTIDCLAKFQREPGFEWLAEPLRKAVAFCRWFQHPDDSYSGVYGSRGTRHFYPHGMELLADENPDAAALADGYLRALARGTAAEFDDDRMYVHRVAGLLEAYEARVLRTEPIKAFSPGEKVAEGRMRDNVQAESGQPQVESGPHSDGNSSLIRRRVRRHLLPEGEGLLSPYPLQKHFHSAGLYVVRDCLSHTIVSTARGGVFTHFTGEQSHVDAGLVVEFGDGRIAVSQTHDLSTTAVEITGIGESEAIREITAVRMLSYVRFERATPLKQAALHLVMGAIGKRGRTLMRKFLQRRVIAGGVSAPVRMTRSIEFLPAEAGRAGNAAHPARRLRVTDTLELTDPKATVKRLAFASDLQAAYTAAAETYQRSLRRPWQERDRASHGVERRAANHDRARTLRLGTKVMLRKQAIFGVKILGTVVLCAMLYRAVPWRDIVAGAAQIDLGILSLGMLLFVPQTLLSAWRWRAMLRPLAEVSFGDSLRQTLAGSALNLVVPAKLGDLSKVAMVANEPSLRKQAAVRAIVEKLGDVGMLLAAIGLGFLRLDTLSATLLAGGFAAGLMLLKRLQSRSFDYAAWLGSTAILWTMHLSQIHFFLLACGVDVSLAATLQRAPIALFAGLIPAAFCGIGTRDAALVWLFADVAAAPTMALVGMLTALRYLVPGAVGIPVLMSLRRATTASATSTSPATIDLPEQPANTFANRRRIARAEALLEAR